MASPAEPGLRERKRLATRRAIQRAALAVVRERGLDGATVDEISRRADVSPRTFFNYFAAKEDAILGDAPALDSEEAVAEFVADRGPLLRGIARLTLAGSEHLLADVELVAERRAIARLYPEVQIKRMANLHRFELDLADVIRRRLAAEHPELAEDELADRSRLAAVTAFAFLRHAWATWIEHPDASPGLAELVERAFAAGEALVASSEPARVG